MVHQLQSILRLLAFLLLFFITLGFDNLVGRNYTCDELIDWLGKEKHYSNQRRDRLFKLFTSTQCNNNQQHMVLRLYNISYSYIDSMSRRGFSADYGKICRTKDKHAVIFLSNFSINNNYSHFLHALLRLFCALLDSGYIVWDKVERKFEKHETFSLWLDENIKVDSNKAVWLKTFQGELKHLAHIVGDTPNDCITSSELIYGSGCGSLLPPEKWFGYPGCRGSSVSASFGYYVRQVFDVSNEPTLVVPRDPTLDGDRLALLHGNSSTASKSLVDVKFAVRQVGSLTGKRELSNLGAIQSRLALEALLLLSVANITFEGLGPAAMVRSMADTDIFVSMHGAGMTNILFMRPGAAVVEVLPFPLCQCSGRDFFYGQGGYYHGMALALGLRHYTYCAPKEDVVFDAVKARSPSFNLHALGREDDVQCSWKFLHAVQSVHLQPALVLSLLKRVQRDLIASGKVVLARPVIALGAHVNG